MMFFKSGVWEAMPIPFQLLRIVRETSGKSSAWVGSRAAGGRELGSVPIYR